MTKLSVISFLTFLTTCPSGFCQQKWKKGYILRSYNSCPQYGYLVKFRSGAELVQDSPILFKERRTDEPEAIKNCVVFGIGHSRYMCTSASIVSHAGNEISDSAVMAVSDRGYQVLTYLEQEHYWHLKDFRISIAETTVYVMTYKGQVIHHDNNHSTITLKPY